MKSKNCQTISVRLKQAVALTCLIFALSLTGYSQTQEPQKPGANQTANAPQKEPSQEKQSDSKPPPATQQIEAKEVDTKQLTGVTL